MTWLNGLVSQCFSFSLCITRLGTGQIPAAGTLEISTISSAHILHVFVFMYAGTYLVLHMCAESPGWCPVSSSVSLHSTHWDKVEPRPTHVVCQASHLVPVAYLSPAAGRWNYKWAASPWIYVGSRNPNSNPHTCPTSVFTAKSSSLLLNSAFLLALLSHLKCAPRPISVNGVHVGLRHVYLIDTGVHYSPFCNRNWPYPSRSAQTSSTGSWTLELDITCIRNQRTFFFF